MFNALSLSLCHTMHPLRMMTNTNHPRINMKDKVYQRNLADNMKSMREEMDMNQNVLAEKIGITTQGAYSRMENYGMGLNVTIYNRVVKEFEYWQQVRIKELLDEVNRIKRLDFSDT